MTQSLTIESLLSLVHRHYPSGLSVDDPRHSATDETRRLEALRKSAVEDSRAWEVFLQRIQEAIPGAGVWDYPNIRYDPAYSVRVATPDSPVGAPERKEVVLMVSILAPVHLLYADHHKRSGDVTETLTYRPPLPGAFQGFADTLEALAMEAFGTTRLSPGVLATPVPDIQVGKTWFGKVTLADCLFGDHRW